MEGTPDEVLPETSLGDTISCGAFLGSHPGAWPAQFRPLRFRPTRFRSALLRTAKHRPLRIRTALFRPTCHKPQMQREHSVLCPPLPSSASSFRYPGPKLQDRSSAPVSRILRLSVPLRLVVISVGLMGRFRLLAATLQAPVRARYPPLGSARSGILASLLPSVRLTVQGSAPSGVPDPNGRNRNHLLRFKEVLKN